MSSRGGVFISKDSILALGLLLAASLFFYHFPQIDLFFARELYLGKGKFMLSNSKLSDFFHKPVDQFLKYLFLGGLLIYLLICVFRIKLPQWLHEKLNFVFATTFIAQLLIINWGLKEFWGRARPSQLAEFGGHAHFTPAWQMAQECASNCAFTSGHAGMAACVALLAVFFPPRWRGFWLVFSVFFYATASFMRMARGAHFLSDVTISGLIVLAVAMLVKDVLRLKS